MKKTILTLILGIFIISFASAGYTYTLGEELNITATCLNNGYCSNTSNCNINVYSPEGILVIESQDMIMENNSFYLAYTPEVEGIFQVAGFCTDDDLYGELEYTFEVTKTGSILRQSEALIYVILSFGILLLSMITFYFMLVTPYSNEMDEKQNLIIRVTKLKYIKLGLIPITYGLFTWFLNIMIGLSENFASLTMYYGLFGGIFWIMNALSLPLIVVIIVVMLFEIVRDANIQKNIKALGSAIK